MKVLLVSYSDIMGGASRACLRLHRALLAEGVESHLVCSNPKTEERNVHRAFSYMGKYGGKIRPLLDEWIRKIRGHGEVPQWTVDQVPGSLRRLVRKYKPDVVNLHFVNAGYLPIEAIRDVGVPIVWTLHDMWAFTGGCHYAGKCIKYQARCGACPQLNSGVVDDLSWNVWNRKNRSWGDVKFEVVTPSNWLGECARSSTLFGSRNISVIPYSINLDVFTVLDQILYRKKLGLPRDKKLILFGAASHLSDRRKGFDLLLSALGHLKTQDLHQNLHLVVFGSDTLPPVVGDLGYTSQCMGKLTREEDIAALYGACDVFAAPSREDNLPNTVIESLACGTPVVAFDTGGMPDMIEHLRVGYLAKPFDIQDFAKGIHQLTNVESPERKDVRDRCRKRTCELYHDEIQATAYLKLYYTMLAGVS